MCWSCECWSVRVNWRWLMDLTTGRQNLDRAVFQYLKGSVSFVDFKDGVPERSLDLGCGVCPYDIVAFVNSFTEFTCEIFA